MKIRELEDMAVLEAIEKLSHRSPRDVAHLVIDHVSIFILGMTSARPMTINDIAASMALSSAACYKLVAGMEDLGLMARCGQHRTTTKGKAHLYTSVVKSVNLDMKAGKITLCLLLKNGNTMHFSRVLAEGVGGERRRSSLVIESPASLPSHEAEARQAAPDQSEKHVERG